tara:strand:- start:720 stop:1211 length:492 start_codon:yes stop_codon:yes gene_type:complete
MAANEHRNLLDGNRHYPLGYESGDNDSYLGKGGGATYNDKTGNLVWSYILQTFVLVKDGTLATEVSADYIRMPYSFRLTTVRASVRTTGSSVLTINILKNGSSILSTLLTIDAGEKTSTTAAVPAVILDYAIADDDEITFDITLEGESAPIDAKVYLVGYKTT